MDEKTVSQTTLRELLQGLQRSYSKQIPVSLLYDDRGSQLYEQIVELEEYYPYAAESQLLEENALRIARCFPPDCTLVELGCGTATKTALLLNALQALHGRCDYVGLDVSSSFLKQARKNLLKSVQNLSPRCLHFIQGEYMDGLEQARQAWPHKLFCIVWLGSSIGNLTAQDAIPFMRQVLSIVGPKCLFFLCTDQWKDTNVLYKAYHDEKGVAEEFIKNGMKHALNLLGHACSEEEENSWLYHVQINSKLRRVEMWITFPSGLSIEEHKVHIRPGESVLVETSRKFTVPDIQELAMRSNFYIQEAWRSRVYGCQMLYSQLQALLSCWDDTDALFNGIADWSLKPIDLRHPFLFYYGHLNAFTRLKLLGTKDASSMDIVFSRGIDPCVMDPSKCHKHPERPPQWPSCESVRAYVRTVRSLVMKAIEEGTVPMRLVYLVLEHERMHHETIIYMVTQQRKAEFEKKFQADSGSREEILDGLLMKTQNVDLKESCGGQISERNIPKVVIVPGEISMGLLQSEAGFVWDNELPLVETYVTDPFMISKKPVSIEEYLAFVEDGAYNKPHLWEKDDYLIFKQQGYKWPATWSHVGGDYYVHGQSETKHWKEVASDAVFVSLAEADAYCKWAGNFRIMKEEEYHRALAEDGCRVQALRNRGWEWTSTPFGGFPGFKAMPEYEEYSADFFDGKHFVLKGSSPATHPGLVRDSFRNFYQRQYRYVFAKFRCCKSLPNQSLARADSNGLNSKYRSAVFGHV